MFQSDNIDYNPFESLFKRPSFSDQNPIAKQDHDPPFFSNFPSPFFDEHELPLSQMLLPEINNMLQPGNGDDQFVVDQNQKKFDSTKKETAKRGINGASKSKEKGPRKRTGKKDRHSKICTAQGIRDRRMRLSLQVARKFFDLQDMLGYDKASKTIEWLFSKSKTAIKELTKDNPERNNNISISDIKSDSFISECEGVSGIEEINSVNEIKIEKQKPRCKSKTNMRESREKARARARCRTREKMMIKKLGSLNSSFEGVDQENQERVSTYGVDFVNQLGPDVGTIEKLLGNSCSTSTFCPIPDNQLDPFMGFLGNWDLLNNDRLSSSHVAVTNQVSFSGNYPNSVYSAICSPSFPSCHQ